MTKPIMMRQVKLEGSSAFAKATVSLTTYIEDDPRVKIGSVITLKDYVEPNRKWKVIYIADQPRKKSEIKTKWNNNI